ncbi:MAG: ExbD/TolR family protein [Planctomycetaceae bacterium]
MRVPVHQARGDMSENMMTSMIDVVFLLLIFFVCAAAGAAYELLLPTDLAAEGATPSVERPQATERQLPRDQVWIRLSVDDAGRLLMRLNNTDYDSFDALQQVLLNLGEAAPENPVILDIAPEVLAGEMVRVYDTCRAARFRSIWFHAAPSVR